MYRCSHACKPARLHVIASSSRSRPLHFLPPSHSLPPCPSPWHPLSHPSFLPRSFSLPPLPTTLSFPVACPPLFLPLYSQRRQHHRRRWLFGPVQGGKALALQVRDWELAGGAEAEESRLVDSSLGQRAESPCGRMLCRERRTKEGVDKLPSLCFKGLTSCVLYVSRRTGFNIREGPGRLSTSLCIQLS